MQLPTLKKLAFTVKPSPLPDLSAATKRLLDTLGEQEWSQLQEATLINAWGTTHRVLTDSMGNIVSRCRDSSPSQHNWLVLATAPLPTSPQMAKSKFTEIDHLQLQQTRHLEAGDWLSPVEWLRFGFALEELDVSWLFRPPLNLRVLVFRPRSGVPPPKTFHWPDPGLRCTSRELG